MSVIICIPKYEYSPHKITNNINGTIPICSTLKGKLKIPVPIALANNVNIAALNAPFLIGPKALFKKVFF